MKIIPIYEAEAESLEPPHLSPTTDILTALKTIKKTLLVWDTMPGKPDFSKLVEYVSGTIKKSQSLTPAITANLTGTMPDKS
jgi:hypothetical protein